MSYCVKCGHQVTGTANFCSSCGPSIGSGYTPSSTQSVWRRRGPLFWTGIGCASLAGLAIALLIVAVVVAAIEDLSGQSTSTVTQSMDDESGQYDTELLASATEEEVAKPDALELEATPTPTSKPEATPTPTPKPEVMPNPTPIPEEMFAPPLIVTAGEVELRRVGQSVSDSTLTYIRESDGTRFEEISYHFSGKGPGITEDFAARDGMLCADIKVNPETGPYEFWLMRNEGSLTHGRLVQEFNSRATGSSSCVTIYYLHDDMTNRDESFVGTVRGKPVFRGDRIVDGFFTFSAGTYHFEVNTENGAPWEIRVCTKEPLKEGFSFRPGCNEPSVGEPTKDHNELVHLSIGQLWYLTVDDYKDYCGIIRDDYWHVINEHDSTTFVFILVAANQLEFPVGEISRRLILCGLDLNGRDCVGNACDWEVPPKLLPDGRLVPPVFKDQR